MQKLSRKAEQSFFGMLILTDFLTQQPFLQNNSDNILKSVHSFLLFYCKLYLVIAVLPGEG